MKTRIRSLFLLPVLIAGLGLLLAGRATAQTFKVLHTFTAVNGQGHNSDGASPQAGLLLSGNTLYGAAKAGGSWSSGTVFSMNTDGTGYTNLHNFGGGDPSEGAYPYAGLILSGNSLYGTTHQGGGASSDNGTVFKVNTDGTGFTNLHSFTAVQPYPQNTNSDGYYPTAGLIVSGNTLYGTAELGGSLGYGTVFKVNTNGTGFTNLHTFDYASDGAYPTAGLILSGNTLYGTTEGGSPFPKGTVFAVTTDGAGFTNLHSFAGDGYGANPYAGLILSGSTLYGTAELGGISSLNGTVFAVNTDGTGYTNLHRFTATLSGTNNDGALPLGGLVQSGNTLFGTTYKGGSSSNGTVFAVNADGTGFTNLHSFTATFGSSSTNSDGANPYAGLILSGSTLYGTAQKGGTNGNGTVFSLSLTPPPLAISRFGTNVVLTWPTYAPGVTLQSTTNLVPPSVWSTVSPGPVVVNGQNTVTNPLSGPRRFYRLSQ